MTLEVQTVAFQINFLRRRYNQLLSQGIPTLKVQTVAFWMKASLNWRCKQLHSQAPPTLQVQTVAL